MNLLNNWPHSSSADQSLEAHNELFKLYKSKFKGNPGTLKGKGGSSKRSKGSKDIIHVTDDYKQGD